MENTSKDILNNIIHLDSGENLSKMLERMYEAFLAQIDNDGGVGNDNWNIYNLKKELQSLLIQAAKERIERESSDECRVK